MSILFAPARPLSLVASVITLAWLTACGGGSGGASTAGTALSVSAAASIPATGVVPVIDPLIAPAPDPTAVPGSGAASDAVASSVRVPASRTVDVYVSTSGSDAFTGAHATTNTAGTDGPVQTIAAAQAVVRTRLASMASNALARLPIRVLIEPGTYALSAPLAFTPAD